MIYMTAKNISIFVIVFLLIVLVYSTTKNFFTNKFASIEKKQDEILKEIQRNKITTDTTSEESPSLDLVQEVGRLKAEVTKLKDQVEEQDDILGLAKTASYPTVSLTPSKSVNINFVTITDRKWQNIEVYQDKNSSSKIIGQAVYGKYYPFTKKEAGFYFIDLNENVSGWILSQFVKEY